MNINLVYGNEILEEGSEGVEINLDLSAKEDKIPVLLKENNIPPKNLNLHEILMQIGLLKQQSDSGLFDKGITINILNTRLIGGFLHAQAFTYLAELGEEDVSLVGYPTKWEENLVRRAEIALSKGFSYLADIEKIKEKPQSVSINK